jgi:hypothetical protein
VRAVLTLYGIAFRGVRVGGGRTECTALTLHGIAFGRRAPTSLIVAGGGLSVPWRPHRNDARRAVAAWRTGRQRAGAGCTLFSRCMALRWRWSCAVHRSHVVRHCVRAARSDVLGRDGRGHGRSLQHGGCVATIRAARLRRGGRAVSVPAQGVCCPHVDWHCVGRVAVASLTRAGGGVRMARGTAGTRQQPVPRGCGAPGTASAWWENKIASGRIILRGTAPRSDRDIVRPIAGCGEVGVAPPRGKLAAS